MSGSLAMIKPVEITFVPTGKSMFKVKKNNREDSERHLSWLQTSCGHTHHTGTYWGCCLCPVCTWEGGEGTIQELQKKVP